MATLNTTPRSSSKKQHQKLVLAGLDRGFDLAAIRKAVGGSICKLSTAECSDWIKHYSGDDLPNPPGEKPSVYRRKRCSDGAVRMITDDLVEQIDRLGWAYFSDVGKFENWLTKNFAMPFAAGPGRIRVIRSLGTAKRATEVIVVLKRMLARREK